MSAIDSFDDYAASLRRFMDGQGGDSSRRASGSAGADDSAFDELAVSLFRLQYGSVLPYRQLCDSLQRSPARIAHWTEIPAVPTSAFKELKCTSLAPAERTTVFHSSGTTRQRPSRHVHNTVSLALYETSLWLWFRAHLLADLHNAQQGAETLSQGRSLALDASSGGLLMDQEAGRDSLSFLYLTPPAARVPHSSLVHMFEAIRRHFGGEDCWFVGEADVSGAWTLDMDQALRALHESSSSARRLILLGTAFSFVHLLDQLAERHLSFALPPGSRVMETGGYKGRSRFLAQRELHGLITERLGIPGSRIVCEYGMSELSSQAYDRAIPCGEGQRAKGKGRPTSGHQTGAKGDREPVERCFHFPPWARVQIVSPETGQEVADGETGLIRVVDLANMRSVLAVQTEDLAVRRGRGFDLIGRAAQAEPRGCSLMAAL